MAVRRLFFARFAKTVMQSSWMVVVFLLPVLLGVGVARCAPCMFYVTALLTIAPFCVIPVAAGTGTTLLFVNVFPARRARDILMLMGLVFAGSIVLLLRFIQPERLLRVESLPDVTGFFATLQSPITPMLPSFWAGETLFASLAGGRDLLHAGALWTTACAFTVLLSAASERWYFSGFSKSQEARKARFAQTASINRHSTDGLGLFRREQHEAALRCSSARPGRTGRAGCSSPTSPYRTIDQVGAKDNELFKKKGLAHADKAVALVLQACSIVEDPELHVHNADELRAELAAGLRVESSDFNPMRMFRQRK